MKNVVVFEILVDRTNGDRRRAAAATLLSHGKWVRALAVLPDGRLASGGDDGYIKIWPITGHHSPPAGRGAQHRSSGPDGSLSQDAGRADPGAETQDAAQGGQDCERPEEGDRVAEDAGGPISAAASRGSDGRLRLQVAVARTRRWRRAAVTGSRRGVRQCGKARHLGQRMANALPSPGPKSLWPILVVRESLTARWAIRREEPLVRNPATGAAVSIFAVITDL